MSVKEGSLCDILDMQCKDERDQNLFSFLDLTSWLYVIEQASRYNGRRMKADLWELFLFLFWTHLNVVPNFVCFSLSYCMVQPLKESSYSINALPLCPFRYWELNSLNGSEFLKGTQGSSSVMLNQGLKLFVQSLDSDVRNPRQWFSRGHRETC